MGSEHNAGRFLAATGMIGALYAVVTLAVAPLGFGPVQFRFSELLVLLVCIDRRYSWGLILGCAVANCFSPLGIADVFAGSFATACSVWAMAKTKKLWIATLWPTFFCFIIGLEWNLLFGYPFLWTTATIMLGEFGVVTIAGYPLFRHIMKNPRLLERLRIFS